MLADKTEKDTREGAKNVQTDQRLRMAATKTERLKRHKNKKQKNTRISCCPLQQPGQIEKREGTYIERREIDQIIRA